jgi:hypothetical protein
MRHLIAKPLLLVQSCMQQSAAQHALHCSTYPGNLGTAQTCCMYAHSDPGGVANSLATTCPVARQAAGRQQDSSSSRHHMCDKISL